MDDDIPTGTERVIEGRLRVYYDGYWIKAYAVPADTLLAKKRLIEALTRRLFQHVEHGLNVPGRRLDEARRSYEGESEPARKRVKGAMLAGALFNRATDVITKLVELQALGVKIEADNPLMRQCGHHLAEALDLGKMVLHRSGEEGIDELWGEPFKAFAFPIEEFYRSRYQKIALTMRDIDRLHSELARAFEGLAAFDGLMPLISDFTTMAKRKCETLGTDPDVFDTWTSLVVAAERLAAFQPRRPLTRGVAERQTDAQRLLARVSKFVLDMARARAPMPKTLQTLLADLESFRATLRAPGKRVTLGSRREAHGTRPA
jgi:hypothetical protein